MSKNVDEAKVILGRIGKYFDKIWNVGDTLDRSEYRDQFAFDRARKEIRDKLRDEEKADKKVVVDLIKKAYEDGEYEEINKFLELVRNRQVALREPYFDMDSSIWSYEKVPERKFSKEEELIIKFKIWLYSDNSSVEFNPKEDYFKTDTWFRLQDSLRGEKGSFIRLENMFSENNGLSDYQYCDNQGEEILTLTEKGKEIFDKNVEILSKALGYEVEWYHDTDDKYYNISVYLKVTDKKLKKEKSKKKFSSPKM